MFSLGKGQDHAAQNPNLLAAERYLRQKNFSRAVELLKTLEKERSRLDPELYVMLAVGHINLGENAQAVAAVERGLKSFPGSARLETFYVSILPATVETAVRKSKLEEQVVQSPNSPVYLKALGEFLLIQNPLDTRVEPLLARARSLAPDDAEAHYLYGRWACLNNKGSVCVTELRKAASLSAANDLAQMQIYVMLGAAEDILGNTEAAEAAFRAGLKFNRKLSQPDPSGAFRYAKFLLDHSRPDEAKTLIDEILKYSPMFAPALFERAKFLAKQGQTAQAVKVAEAALAHTGDDPTQLHAIHMFLAKTLFTLGQINEATAHQSWIEAHQ